MAVREIECRVTGKVSGVNFRNFVAQKARGLWLLGEVANAPDWSVRVIAQGEEAQLEQLIAHLHKGPFTAKVSNVDVVWREPTRKFNSFEIVY